MPKGLKFGLVFVSLFLIYKIIGKGTKNQKKMIFDNVFKKYGALRLSKFAKVYDALEKAGLKDLKLKFALAQIMQETGVFGSTSNVFDLNNNASGITYSGSAGQLSTGAIKGSARPIKEGGNYAKYPNLTSWAKDYLRILNKGTMPLNSVSIDDFVKRLKENKYFTDTLENYLKNSKFYFNLINV